eukprot:scaffold24137_cov57-Phaeocystis_antarctica.AAC.3
MGINRPDTALYTELQGERISAGMAPRRRELVWRQGEDEPLQGGEADAQRRHLVEREIDRHTASS